MQRCYLSNDNSADSEGANTGRERRNELADKYIIGKLTVDYNDKRVYISGTEVILTKKENEILILLTKNPNKIYSREDILKYVWKNESYVLDRTVDVHIARLRKKLGEHGNMIINRSGYGYCFQPQH